MASPITTSGFYVQERPSVNYLDPRLFAPQYGNIIPSIQQGLGAYSQLQQIRDDAVTRPIRQQLQQIQLSDAIARQGLAPLEVARKGIELSQPIESVEGLGIKPVARPDMLQPMTDADGNAIIGPDGNPRIENIAGSGGQDIVSTETIKEIDPATGAVTFRQRQGKPISTVEQQNVAQSLMDARAAAAKSAEERNQIISERDALRAENDRIKADAMQTRAEAALNDPKWRVVSSGVDEHGNMVINQVNGTGELRQIPTGQKPRSNTAIFGGLNLYGGQPGGAAVPGASAVDPDVAALVKSMGGAPTVTSAPLSTPSFSTVQEAEQAARAGLIKNGTKIIVGGKPATWHD